MEEAMKKNEEKLVHEATQKVEEAMKKILEEKMNMELHLDNFIHEHKMNTDETRMKMRKIKRYALGKEISIICYQCYWYPSRGLQNF
jgi:hypothetical protein